MSHDRRSVLSAVGLLLPLGSDRCLQASARADVAPTLWFRTFEEGVRCAFERPAARGAESVTGVSWVRRIEVGHGDVLLSGVQGCYNERPFAGFAPGRLRIVRSGCEAGPIVWGVRLYVCTVDVSVCNENVTAPGRPLDFASVPPAPVFSAESLKSNVSEGKQTTLNGRQFVARQRPT